MTVPTLNFPITPSAHSSFSLSPPAGTPTEDTWPGITSNEEFKAYNFTQYRAQPLINHAPRYPLQQGQFIFGGVEGCKGEPGSFSLHGS